MFVEPAHIYMNTPVTPFHAPWVLGTAAFLVIVGEAGTTQQITDQSGRTMFEPGLAGVPTRWDQIRRNVSQRVPNLGPIMRAEKRTGGAQGWIGNGVGATHTYDIAPTAAAAIAGIPVQTTFHSGGISSRFAIQATTTKADRITAHDINGPNKAISLALPADAIAKTVAWTISGGEKQRWMELSNMLMSPAQSIRIRPENAAGRLRVNNSSVATTATVRYQAGPGVAKRNLGLVQIPQGDSVIDPDGVAGPGPCNPNAPFDAPVPAFTGTMNADGLTFSADGLTAYVSAKASPTADYDLYVATRSNTTVPFGPLTLLPNVNNLAHQRAPSLSPDGLALYMTSTATGSGDIAVATRPNIGALFGAATAVVPLNSSVSDQNPFWVVMPGGLQTLFFASERPNGAHRDIYQALPLAGGTWQIGKLTGPVTSLSEDYRPVLTPDGLTLYFASTRTGIGGDTGGDIFMAKRASTLAEFGQPVNMWGLNSSGTEFPVNVSADGCTLYFASSEETGFGNGTFRLYQAKRGSSIPATVTTRIEIVGNGSVTAGGFNCASSPNGNVGTCTVAGAPYTMASVWANRQGVWQGSCTGHNGNPSTDGIVVFANNGVCTITFPP